MYNAVFDLGIRNHKYKYVLFSSTLSLGDFKRRCKFKLKFHECCVKCVIREAALVYNQLEAVFRVKSNDFINSPC